MQIQSIDTEGNGLKKIGEFPTEAYAGRVGSLLVELQLRKLKEVLKNYENIAYHNTNGLSAP